MQRIGHIAFVATSKPMLHLLLSDKPGVMGGAELQLFLHARRLVEEGWEVTFLAGNYDETPQHANAHGMSIIKGPLPPDGGLAGQVRAPARFRRALEAVDADIYVSRGLTAQAGIIARFCRTADKRYIFWFGKNADAWYGDPKASPFGAIEKRLAAYGIRNAFEVVVQTEQQSELLSRHIGRRGCLIRNIHPGSGHAPSPDDDSTTPGRTVLWVGSMQPKKRPLMVLEVARILPKQQFVMLGGPIPGTEEFAEQVREETAQQPNVTYQGFIPYAETHAYFSSAALLLNTSEPELEGFPNTYLQAWAAGAPVVGTCDPDDVIRRFNLGRQCASARELADAISLLQTDASLRAECGGAARRYIEEHHTGQAVFGALDALLARALSDSERADP